ncbi:MAG: NAD-dependent nucleoside diphosphate-sugar epimerase/dehydratase [Phycisphaerales bacterium]|nr:NAD-dependent nucleoside diphosphate-sugar epimerase/dehydratase [Phycisphaerales bacterium]
MPNTVFVTGGGGFVGAAVLDELVARGHAAKALTRPGGRPIPDRDGHVQAVSGELSDTAAVDAGLAGCDAVIHLVGVIAERPAAGMTFERVHVDGTRAVVEAASRAGVQRYIHMSALGTRPNAVSAYHRTKWAAEELVRASSLDWTILRPSLIHGPRGDFTRMQAAWARRRAMPFLFMPYFAGGLLGLAGGKDVQPVYVGDVARAFVDALEKPATVGQTYAVVGPDRMRWPTMHKTFARALTGKGRATAGIPRWYATLLTRVVPAGLLPFNLAQVQMAAEDNVGDPGRLARDLGWAPRPYEATVLTYAGNL